LLVWFIVYGYIIQWWGHPITRSLHRLNPSICRLMACWYGSPSIYSRLSCSWWARLSSHTDIWGPIPGSHLRYFNIDLSIVWTFPQVDFSSIVLCSPLIIKTLSTIHRSSRTQWSVASRWALMVFGFIAHFEVGCSLLIFEFLWYFICWVRIFLIQNFFTCSYVVFSHLGANFSELKMMSF